MRGVFLVSLLNNLEGDTFADLEKNAYEVAILSSYSSPISSKSLLLGLVDWKLLLLLLNASIGLPGSVRVSPRALLFLAPNVASDFSIELSCEFLRLGNSNLLRLPPFDRVC